MNLQIFKNVEFGEIRTVQRNNETYFVGKDVADALGYGYALIFGSKLDCYRKPCNRRSSFC